MYVLVGAMRAHVEHKSNAPGERHQCLRFARARATGKQGGVKRANSKRGKGDAIIDEIEYALIRRDALTHTKCCDAQ